MTIDLPSEYRKIFGRDHTLVLLHVIHSILFVSEYYLLIFTIKKTIFYAYRRNSKCLLMLSET